MLIFFFFFLQQSCSVPCSECADAMLSLFTFGINSIVICYFLSVTKACLVSASVFLMEKLNYIQAPHPLIYFGVVMFLVYFKLSALLLGIHDPFAPFENLFCAIFMGGMWDALRRAVVREPKKEEDKDGRNDIPIKSKEDKKKD